MWYLIYGWNINALVVTSYLHTKASRILMWLSSYLHTKAARILMWLSNYLHTKAVRILMWLSNYCRLCSTRLHAFRTTGPPTRNTILILILILSHLLIQVLRPAILGSLLDDVPDVFSRFDWRWFRGTVHGKYILVSVYN